MWKRMACALAAVLALSGCGTGKPVGETGEEQVRRTMESSFQTTAKVRYKDLETEMTIYKKPMNCAVVQFDSPDSLKDLKMTYFTDRIAVEYKGMHFDFTPDGLPGQAASKLVVSAFNAAMRDEGVKVEQKEKRFIVSGELAEGSFSLVLDRESGNILKLDIPSSELELEALNFKFLE